MLSEALRLIRVFHDLKQFEVAEHLGISKSHISEVEKGTKTPSLELLKKYSTEFRIPMSSIMFFAEALPNAQKGKTVQTALASKVIDILRFVERKSDVGTA